MSIQPTMRAMAIALGAALLLSTAPIAYAYDSDQPEQSVAAAATNPITDANGVTHITGGVGDDERDAIESVRGQYNVHITNSNKDGAFNDSTQITITDKAGVELVSADAGPLFFVNLPKGSYNVLAQHREMQQTKKITIGKTKKSQPDLHFIW
jgi:hypothetical protein